MGVVRLHFRNKFLLLNNVYFIPDFRRNLISMSRLFEQIFSVSFLNNEIIISKNGLNICSAKMENRLYMLRSDEQSLLNTEKIGRAHV